METIEKIYDLKKLKEEIKVAAAYQRFLKDQRKSVHNKLPREIGHREASLKHARNRAKLSAMYVAYGVMRGKDLREQLNAHISKKNDWMCNQEDEFSYNERKAKNTVDILLREYKLKEKVEA